MRVPGGGGGVLYVVPGEEAESDVGVWTRRGCYEWSLEG